MDRVEPDSRHETYDFDDEKRVEVSHHGAEVQVGIYRKDQPGVAIFAGRELVKLYRILRSEAGTMSDRWEGEVP